MINTVYSLLVSGADPIPTDFVGYRKHAKLQFNIPGIVSYSDPFRRSLWANYIIELSKISQLWNNVLELDPSNTYKYVPGPFVARSDISNGCLVTPSDIYPVATGNAIISGDTAICVINGDEELLPVKDGTIDILGNIVHITDPTDVCEFVIHNPAIRLDIPTKTEILKSIKYLPDDVKNSMDLDKPFDRACVLCIASLRKYKNI